MSDFMSTRSQVGAISQRCEQHEERIAALEQQITELFSLVQQFASGARRIKRDGQGRAVALEILSNEGEVISTQAIMRGPDGMAIGTRAQ